MCNSFGFVGFNSIVGAAAVWERFRKDHRIEFSFFVAVVVGAQCKINELPFATKSLSFWSAGKSSAWFAVIESIDSSECWISFEVSKFSFVAVHLKNPAKRFKVN